jgi:hypothetical protein
MRLTKEKKQIDKSHIAESKFKTKFDDNGRRIMMCQNSIPDGKYWKGELCDNMSVVSHDAIAILCSYCVTQIVEAPQIRGVVIKSDKPKGWKFMKEFVTQDGIVYHKGVEQPSLKGTLAATVIEPKPEKKRLTKAEKESAILTLGTEIKGLKGELFVETRKGKRADIAKKLSKANRDLKKLI